MKSKLYRQHYRITGRNVLQILPVKLSDIGVAGNRSPDCFSTLTRNVLDIPITYIIPFRHRNGSAKHSLALQVECVGLDFDTNRWYTRVVGRIVYATVVRATVPSGNFRIRA